MTADLSYLPANHPPVKIGKVGVLLVNLGTPDGTDYASMRRYLKEFLMDRRVIEWSRWKWYPILFGIVLNTRPQKVGKAYEEIWNKEQNESYLRTYTRNQSDAIAEALKDHPEVIVDWAMRYGQPSIGSRIEALQAAGCDRILLFPLYPQYAASTTATVNDKAFEKLMSMRWQPALRTVPPYHDDPEYIDALAVSVEKKLATLDWQPEMLLASFHGIPQSYFRQGDPYHCFCMKTGRTAARTPRPSQGEVHGHLPVPFRTGGMAAALYRQDSGEACQRGGQAHRGDQSRLRVGLSRDFGRDSGRGS